MFWQQIFENNKGNKTLQVWVWSSSKIRLICTYLDHRDLSGLWFFAMKSIITTQF